MVIYIFLFERAIIPLIHAFATDPDPETYLTSMACQARNVIHAARAEGTWNQYRRCYNKFILWCAKVKKEHLGANHQLVLAYLTQTLNDSESYNVVLMHASAIAAYQEEHGYFHAPCQHRQVVLFLKGAQKMYAKATLPKAAMSDQILLKILTKVLGITNDHSIPRAELHLWRACMFELLAYLAMARYSDLARTTMKDVDVRNDRLLINFSIRKNDQTHKGHSVLILATKDRFCPVLLFQHYRQTLSNALGSPYDGPLLPTIASRNKTYFPTQRTVSYAALRKVQKQVLLLVKIDPTKFGLHSGRRGGATKSGDCGDTESDTCEFGGWSKGSLMPSHYNENKSMSSKFKVAMSLRLQRHDPTP